MERSNSSDSSYKSNFDALLASYSAVNCFTVNILSNRRLIEMITRLFYCLTFDSGRLPNYEVNYPVHFTDISLRTLCW